MSSTRYISIPNDSFTTTTMNMQYQTQPPRPVVTNENTTNILDIFSPLGNKYCVWFYYLSVIGVIFIIMTIISGLYVGLKTKKGFDFYYLIFMTSFIYFIFYFQNRLLYSMCQKSL